MGYLPTMLPWTGQGQKGTRQGQTGTRQGQTGTNRDQQGQSLLSLPVPIYLCISLYVPACPFMPLPVPVSPCLSLFVPVCSCLSLSSVCPCLSLSVPIMSLHLVDLLVFSLNKPLGRWIPDVCPSVVLCFCPPSTPPPYPSRGLLVAGFYRLNFFSILIQIKTQSYGHVNPYRSSFASSIF